MSIETEVKLALPPSHMAAALAFFEHRTGTAGRAIALTNIYFDTPALALFTAGCALRLRHTPSGWLQTFKAGGSVSDGVHRRHEWELPVPSDALQLDALRTACADAAAGQVLAAAAHQLIEVFRTDFTRTLWQLRVPAIAGVEAMPGAPTTDVKSEAEIEVAVDAGLVMLGDDRRRTLPISEIELELKHGDDAALERFTAELRSAMPVLTPENVSKAERGYQLRSAEQQ